MTYDLHLHSTASDGTDTPGALATLALQAGLDGFALTDHDTTAGLEEAGIRAAEQGIDFIPGIELTAQHDGGTIHVLGHFINPQAPSILTYCTQVQTFRQTRAQRIVERLAEDYPLSWEQVLEHAADPRTIGRPHIADTLVALGLFDNRPAVFAGVLGDGSPYVIEIDAPTVETAITAITEAGGATTIAHLKSTTRTQNLVDEATLTSWVKRGLRGLEVHHHEHTTLVAKELLAISGRCGLIPTAGSDYHGRGKPNTIAEHTVSRATVDLLREAAHHPTSLPS